MTITTKTTTPDRIMQLGFGFMGAKALLSALELGVFTHLADRSMTCDELVSACGLHTRAALDFFDALVSLGMLERHDGRYANTDETATFLVKGRPAYVGGILEMANARLYPFWGTLTDGLKTGRPQNETQSGQDKDAFARIYADQANLRGFLEAMTGISLGSGRAIAAKFPFDTYKTFMDVGTAQGGVAGQVALAHAHLQGIGFDLAQVGPIFDAYMRSLDLQDRVRFQAGDFFKESLPTADVIIMGHILHDWGMDDKRMLIAKVYAALPQGGAFVIHEALIDDDRRVNTFGLLMSLNMLIETHQGFDYTGQQCQAWLHEAGFRETRVEHLVGPDWMIVAIK